MKEEKQKAKEQYDRILQGLVKFIIKEGKKNNWNILNLSQVAEVIMGQSPPGESYNRERIGKPLINGPTEFGDSYPIPLQWTTQPTKLARKGDILLCVRGSTTGRMNLADQEYYIGRGIAAIRLENKFPLEILYLLLENMTNEIMERSRGSTFPNIKLSELNSLKIIIPPNSYQDIIRNKINTIRKSIKEICDKQINTSSQLSLLPKSVLSKAFRGELV